MGKKEGQRGKRLDKSSRIVGVVMGRSAGISIGELFCEATEDREGGQREGEVGFFPGGDAGDGGGLRSSGKTMEKRIIETIEFSREKSPSGPSYAKATKSSEGGKKISRPCSSILLVHLKTKLSTYKRSLAIASR